MLEACRKSITIYFISRVGSRQHCNVTKVASLAYIENSVDELSKIIKKDKGLISWTVDNLTATGDIQSRINLRYFIENQTDHHWMYNSENFPGAFLKKNGLNVILFSSGKVTWNALWSMWNTCNSNITAEFLGCVYRRKVYVRNWTSFWLVGDSDK